MFEFPIQVDIDITENCNFSCQYCSAANRKNIKDELTINQFKQIIDELYNMGTYSFNFAGGEPLLKEGIYDLIEYTLKKPFIDLTLVTNGSLLDSRLFRIAMNTSFHLVISIDSFINSVNDIYRESTDKVIKNIKILKNNEIPFSIAQVLTKKNIDFFEKNVNILKNNGIEDVLIIKYVSLLHKDQTDDNEIPYEQWKNFIEKITALNLEDKIRNYKLSVSCPWEIYLPMLNLGYSLSDVSEIWGYSSPLMFYPYSNSYNTGCHAGITSCNIISNGDVYPCVISGENKKLLCGNIIKDDFKSIWKNSKVLNKLRNIKMKDISEVCEKCKYVTLCGGGCRIRSFYKDEYSLTSRDFSCPYFMEGIVK